MASRLDNFVAVLSTAWEAVSPTDDGTATTYRQIDTLDEERGNGQHREFQWTEPTRARLMSEATLQLEWQVSAEVFLHRGTRTRSEFRRAISHDVLDLQRAFSQLTNLGAGVIEVVLDDVQIEAGSSPTKPRAGGARRAAVVRVVFPFRALIGEV